MFFDVNNCCEYECHRWLRSVIPNTILVRNKLSIFAFCVLQLGVEYFSRFWDCSFRTGFGSPREAAENSHLRFLPTDLEFHKITYCIMLHGNLHWITISPNLGFAAPFDILFNISNILYSASRIPSEWGPLCACATFEHLCDSHNPHQRFNEDVLWFKTFIQKKVYFMSKRKISFFSWF